VARLTPAFSANRAVRQYAEKHYLSLASAYCARSANSGHVGADLVAWARKISSYWQDLYFASVAVTESDGKYLFSLQIHLGRISPGDARIEIYADPLNSDHPFCEPMAVVRAVPNMPGTL
jgi:starch phosphorylase